LQKEGTGQEKKVAVLTPVPKIDTVKGSKKPLDKSRLFGRWCGKNMTFVLSEDKWTYQLADGSKPQFNIIRYEVHGNVIRVFWRDFRKRLIATEFGEFSNDDNNVRHIRGRLEPNGEWKTYDRFMGRC
jgi:hypothetical protein